MLTCMSKKSLTHNSYDRKNRKVAIIVRPDVSVPEFSKTKPLLSWSRSISKCNLCCSYITHAHLMPRVFASSACSRVCPWRSNLQSSFNKKKIKKICRWARKKQKLYFNRLHLILCIIIECAPKALNHRHFKGSLTPPRTLLFALKWPKCRCQPDSQCAREL